jgi:Helix-hairpin-helix motif
MEIVEDIEKKPFNMKYLLSIVVFCWLPIFACAQNEVTEDANLTETLTENEAETQLLIETLAQYQQHPIDINVATAQDLAQLHLLTPPQINALIVHREKAGNFLSLLELQGIDFFNELIIRRILPYIKINETAKNTDFPLKAMLTKGSNEVRLRWQKNNIPLYEPTEKRFLESHNSLISYRNRYQNNHGFGFMASQDAGEPFAKNINKYGFDFYSFNFFSQIKSLNIQKICLGDFSVQFGQGLLTYTGYARTSTGAFVTSTNRNAPTLTPFTATRESGFFRGVGTVFTLSKQLKLTTFAAFNPIDARLDTNSTTKNVTIRSLQNTGYHREGSELTNKNASNLFSGGFSLRYDTKYGAHLALNSTYHQFSNAYQPEIKLYNQFNFNGLSLLGGSVDYAFQINNAYFFGETALSQNGGIATLNGALVSLDKRVSMSLLHRYLARNYQSLYAKPFGGDANNANGLYAGLDLQLHKKWQLAGYADLVRHDWLRFGVNAPSASVAYFARLSFTKRKKIDAYLQFSTVRGVKNNSINATENTYILSDIARQSARAQVSFIASKAFTWQGRGEVTFGENLTNRGILLYGNGVYKPSFSSLSIATRLAYFDVNDYGTRIYTLEKDVTQAYSGNFYYGKGLRGYISAQYRVAKNYILEAKLGQTWYTKTPNPNFLEKGLEAKIQIRVTW